MGTQVLMIGMGTMGGALTTAVSKHKATSKWSISALEIDADKHTHNAIDKWYSQFETCNIEHYDIVVIAVKPQQFARVAEWLRQRQQPDSTVLLSIMAGVTVADIERATGWTHIVRAMPNIAAQYGASVTALCHHSAITKQDTAQCQAIAEAVGSVVMLPEQQFNAFIGISASGIAILLHTINALKLAGVAQGIPYAQGSQIVDDTVQSALALLQSSNKHIQELITMISSPGGTTIAALQMLERRAATGAVVDAVSEAVKRANTMHTS